jgi:hypothetical protein
LADGPDKGLTGCPYWISPQADRITMAIATNPFAFGFFALAISFLTLVVAGVF